VDCGSRFPEESEDEIEDDEIPSKNEEQRTVRKGMILEHSPARH